MEFKGTDSPKIYIIDHHSHPEDIEAGYPLSGSRGQFVCSLLGSMDLLSEVRFACWSDQTPSVVSEDIIKCSPKLIIGFGSELLKELAGSVRSITEMSGSIFDVKIGGVNFKYLAMISPSYVLRRLEDNETTLRFSQDLYKAFQFINGEYRDVFEEKKVLSAHSYQEFADFCETYLKDNARISYDIETNARPPMFSDSRIIGFSVANDKAGIYVSVDSLDFHMDKEEEDRIWDYLINEQFENKKLIIHNTMYERPYTLCCKNYEIGYEKADDTLVMARLLRSPKEGAGLKYQAQKYLHYPDWETDLGRYISGFKDLVNRIGFGPKKFVNIWDEIRLNKVGVFEIESTPSFEKLSDSDKEEVSDIVRRVKSPCVELYNDEELVTISNLIRDKVVEVVNQGGIKDSTIPYNFIPDKVLSQYGALDAISTYELCEFFEDKMDKESTDKVHLRKGYENWLEHMYVAYIMERNGLNWNEDLVREDEAFLSNQATKCLEKLLKSPLFDPYIVESCDYRYRAIILSDYLPEIAYSQGFRVYYNHDESKYTLYFNGKRCAKGRISEIEIPSHLENKYKSIVKELFHEEINSMSSYEELKELFNPSSTSATDIVRKILMTPTLQMGGRINNLHTLAVSPEFEGCIDTLSAMDKRFITVANMIVDAKGLKEKYGEDWWKTRLSLYEGFVNLYNNYSNYVIAPEIRNILFDREPVKVESFDDGGVITIYNALVLTGIDQDNEESWSEEFKWMINYRLFKKSQKLISSYINGSVGRQSVVVVDKNTLSEGNNRVPRKRYYESRISDNEAYVMAAKWSPNTAETGRWRSAQHCHPGWTRIKLADGRDLEIEEVVKEFNKGKDLYVYSINSTESNVNPESEYRIAKIKEAYMSHYAKEFVRFTLDNGEVIDMTPDHKVISRNGYVDYAINFEEGDSLYPAYFKEDEKGYQMIYNPNQDSWKYCYYLADEYNERHNLLREIPDDEYLNPDGTHSKHSWCRHHVDFNFRNNNPDNVIRVGRAAHFTKYHSGNKSYYEKSWEHRRERGNDPTPDFYGRLIKKASEDPEFEKRWKSLKRDSGLESMKKLWEKEGFRKSHESRNKVRGFNKAIQMISTIYDKGQDRLEINEEIYENLRKSQGKSSIGIMKWCSLMRYVESVDDLVRKVREVSYYNHKIVKKEVVTLDEEIPVYSLSIEQDSPNYVVSAGVCIKNTIPWGSQVKKYYTSRFKGGTLVCPDYSQMEVRALAAISHDENMLELFHSGKDFHSQTAASVWQKPVEEVTTAERRFSKTATFSLLYGAMEESFARNYCNDDIAMANKIYGGFFRAYPRVQEWIKERHEEVRRDHRVSLELSNRFIAIEPEGEGKGALNSMLRKSQNYPIQSQSADLTGCVIFDLQKYIEDNGLNAKVIMYVHDSIEIDIPPFEMIQFINQLKFVLNDSPMKRMGLPSKADVALGCSLGHEIEMKSLVHNDEFTECTMVLEGFKDEIEETIAEWKKVYKTVEVSEEEWEENYVSMGDLFILRKAYTPTLGTMRYTGKCKVHIDYYN